MIYGPFDRLNEPLVFTHIHTIQKYWDYDHFKYTKPRDPSIEELQSALTTYNKEYG